MQKYTINTHQIIRNLKNKINSRILIIRFSLKNNRVSTIIIHGFDRNLMFYNSPMISLIAVVEFEVNQGLGFDQNYRG